MKNKISKQLVTIFFISALEEFRAPVFCTIVYNDWLSSSSEAKDIFFLRVELKFCRYKLRGRIVFQWQEYKFVHLSCVCLFSCIRETFSRHWTFTDFHKLFPCFPRIIIAHLWLLIILFREKKTSCVLHSTNLVLTTRLSVWKLRKSWHLASVCLGTPTLLFSRVAQTQGMVR